MIVNPIIPIWLMTLICIVLLVLKRKGIIPYIRQIIIIILLFVINLRIMIPDDIEVSSENIDAKVIFVIDNTISMNAVDYNGETERLEGAKADCTKIIDALNGADFAVISFDNAAKLNSTYTNNTDYVKNSINNLYPPQSFYATGSSMNTSRDLLLETAKRGSENSDDALIVFFISDGEITNNDALCSFSEIRQYIDGGAVLGYGTEDGGKMYVYDYFSDDLEVVQDESDFPSKDAISKIDEKNLKAIAKDLGISYRNMNKNDTDVVIDDIIKDIKENTASSLDNKSLSGYKDIYYIFVIPLLLLLIYEFLNLKFRGNMRGRSQMEETS